MNNVLKSALEYAEQGIPVFPCDPRNKHPYCARGFYAATTNRGSIQAWLWNLPDAMIGVPCGPTSKVWVFDVDVDKDKGIDGPASLEKLIEKYEPLPETRMSLTPRGGEQHFFRWNDDFNIRSSTSKIGAGLDVRGAGGYVILPPSVRIDGIAYRWVNLLPPVDAPQWLIDLAMKSAHDGTPGTVRRLASCAPTVNASSARVHAWARSALKIACDRIANAPTGKRNAVLNAEAFSIFQLVAAGYLDDEQVRARLLEAACACGIDADYGEPSIINTINSAASAGMNQPRFYQGRT
jgi:Bifunctional DNA primase/polymerase, N-terminal